MQKSGETLSRREREKQLKRKWLRSHCAILCLCAVFVFGIFLLLYFFARPLVGAGMLALLVIYALLRHKMMLYVEEKLYGPLPPKR